jgi:tight adherence protein C
MSTAHIGLLALVFLVTSGIGVLAVQLLMPDPMQARLRQAAGASDAAAPVPQDAWQAKIVTALSPAGKMALPKEGWEKSPMRQRFIRAGFRDESAPLVFFGAKTLLTFAFPVVFMIASGIGGWAAGFHGMLMIIVTFAAAGYYLPNIYVGRRIAARQAEMFECLPDAIDLMTIMAEAGLGLDAAIGRIAEEMGIRSRVVEEEFRLVGLELRAGATREHALRNLALRSGVEELDLLVAVLIQTDRFGTSMAESLRVHSEDLRTKRRLRAEEAAAKIGLKLLFPIIFGIFPAIMIVLLGPAAISLYRAFFPVAAAAAGS